MTNKDYKPLTTGGYAKIATVINSIVEAVNKANTSSKEASYTIKKVCKC